MAVPLVSGALEGLRADIAAERLDEYEELIRADVFADFLEMAQHLLDESYKDAAAVLVGGVLEEHLRKLCDKAGVPTNMPTGQAKKPSAMNVDLKKAGVFNNLDEKSVTAQLELRNNAAHGKHGEYSKEEVRLMLETVRDLIRRHPA